jgi:hypothetical protein
VIGHVGKAKRTGLSDQNAEYAAALWEAADPRSGLVVDAQSDEPLQAPAICVEYAESGVARPGDVARGLQDLAEHHLEVELCDHSSSDLDQAVKASLV